MGRRISFSCYNEREFDVMRERLGLKVVLCSYCIIDEEINEATLFLRRSFFFNSTKDTSCYFVRQKLFFR